MRAVRGAQNKVMQQQLSEVNPKYRAGPNELEKEPSLQILQPTNAEQLKQLTSLVEALRRQNQGDQAWQNALRFWQMQITTGALSDRVKFEFVRRFYFWLLGRGTEQDTARTMWGRGNAAVINREVALYIEQFAQRRLDYALELSLLAGRVPDTLNGYYLYFKYIVNGKLQRAKDNNGSSWWILKDDDYLQDFELFQQEFDGNGSGHYKDMIRPAATGDNSKRFDASRPYPASGADMERNKHKAAETAEILAQTVQQQNEGRNEPLPDKMDVSEDEEALPQHEPPVEAIPVPQNEAAVTHTVDPVVMQQYQQQQVQMTQTIGKLQTELREMKQKHAAATQSAQDAMLQKVRDEATATMHAMNERMRFGSDAFVQSVSTLNAEMGKLQSMMQLLQQQAQRFPTNENVHTAAHTTRRAQIHAEVASEQLGAKPAPPPGVTAEQLSELFTKASAAQAAEAKKLHGELAAQYASKLGEATAAVMTAARATAATIPQTQKVADASHFEDPREVDKRNSELRQVQRELFVAHEAAKQQAERAERAEAQARFAAASAERATAEATRASAVTRSTAAKLEDERRAAALQKDAEKRKAMQQENRQRQAAWNARVKAERLEFERAARLKAESEQLAQREAEERKQEQVAKDAQQRALRKQQKAEAAARKAARSLQKQEAEKQKLAAQLQRQLAEAESTEDAKEAEELKRVREEASETESKSTKASRVAAPSEGELPPKDKGEASVTEEDTPETKARLAIENMPTTETETEDDELMKPVRRAKAAAAVPAAKQKKEELKARLAAAQVAKTMDEGARLRAEAQARLEMVAPPQGPKTMETENDDEGNDDESEWKERPQLQQALFKAKQVGVLVRLPRHGPKTATQAKALIKAVRQQVLAAQTRTYRARVLRSKRTK